MSAELKTKSEVVAGLRAYNTTPDEDTIRFKRRIREKLISSQELLYALNNTKYESELFDSDGNPVVDGEWDSYFGENIRPYLFYPETQTKAMNYISYKVEFSEIPEVNKYGKFCKVTFVVMVDGKDIDDKETGIPRHDLLAAILTRIFGWSNIFGTQLYLTSTTEGYTDTNYVTRTLVFQNTKLNGINRTRGGKTTLVNNSEVRT